MVYVTPQIQNCQDCHGYQRIDSHVQEVSSCIIYHRMMVWLLIQKMLSYADQIQQAADTILRSHKTEPATTSARNHAPATLGAAEQFPMA